MSELDPERILAVLAEHEVDFHVIGALAAWLQGNPTVTLDEVIASKEKLARPKDTAALPALYATREERRRRRRGKSGAGGVKPATDSRAATDPASA